MKFPYAMLRDYVETTLGPEAVGDLLTMAGFELEGIEEVEGDQVLDIAVMSNRGDGLSLLGLAREVLAKDPTARETELYRRRATRKADSEGLKPEISVRIETADCTRFAGMQFENIDNGPSPDWIQKRLRQAGQRPISLLVDLTNYVMLEVGQPLHAYDLDKLSGPAIVVRKSRVGERLTTLNGQAHELTEDQMMICDAERPIGVAGVMGGADTEVDAGTKRVFLESAHFVNTSIRRTRKQLGLNTEASYRFERSVDPEGVVAALERLVELLAQSGSNPLESRLVDVYPSPARREPIGLTLTRADRLLGMPIRRDEANAYLTKLGFEVRWLEGTEGQAEVTPPSWRPDVQREEDVIEELGRVHGYEQIPELMPTGATIMGGADGFELWVDTVRESAVRCGFVQTISHSLRDRGSMDEPGTDPVVVRNPNSPEMAWLRSSLLPCLADNARRNGGRDIHLFEIGRVFSAPDHEHLQLGLLSQGLDFVPDWRDKDPAPAGFFDLKASIEAIARNAGVDLTFRTAADPRLHPTRQAALVAGSTIVGILGQIHPDVADEMALPVDTLLAELYLSPMHAVHHAAPRLKSISRNPAVRRDIALLIDKAVPFEAIDHALEESIGDVLERRWLFDVYEGKGIPEGKHSLAIALQIRKAGENFTDEEANQVRARAVAALAGLGGTPR